MKLHPISVSQLLLLESGQFIKRLLTDFENSGLNPNEDAEFKSLLNDLSNKLPTYSDALMQVQAKEETKEIVALDVYRDHKYATVRRAASVFEYSDEEAELHAYHIISLIIKKFGSIETATYEAESMGIEQFIKEVRNSKDNAMNVLGLAPHLERLEIANNDFGKKFDQRSTGNFSTVTYNSKALRKDIFTTYDELTDYVLIMAKRKKNAFFDKLLEVVNNGRAYFADTLARRAAINKRDNPTT